MLRVSSRNEIKHAKLEHKLSQQNPAYHMSERDALITKIVEIGVKTEYPLYQMKLSML